MDSVTAPAAADERRDPDQDTAVEKAFEAGTLPEEDRREFTPEELQKGPDDFPYTPANEMAAFHETALGVADGEGMHDRSARDDYAFPDDEHLAIMTEEEKQQEFLKALAAGWSGAEASGTIWPSQDGTAYRGHELEDAAADATPPQADAAQPEGDRREPDKAPPADAEAARLARMDAVIWNYLGKSDPEEVGEFLRDALKVLAKLRAATPVATAEPEQPLIGDASPSEVLYAFMRWLTSREAISGAFSRHHDAADAARLVNRFCKSQELAPPRENYTEYLKPYPQD